MDSYRQNDRRRRGVPLSDLDPALTEISRKVIGCAIEVHKALGPGHRADVYRNALKIELDREGIGHKQGHAFDVQYDERVVGEAVADMYIADRFVVDVRAYHGEIGSEERSGLRAVLRAGDLELGLIINFGERRLKDGLVRVLNPDKIESLRQHDEHEEHDEDEDDDHDDEE